MPFTLLFPCKPHGIRSLLCQKGCTHNSPWREVRLWQESHAEGWDQVRELRRSKGGSALQPARGAGSQQAALLQHSHFLMACFNLLIGLQHHSQHGVKSPGWFRKGLGERPGLENPNTSTRVSSTQP